MALKTETNIKVDGTYTKGTIKGNVYCSELLIFQPRSKFTKGDVDRAIKELQELSELMDSVQVAETLSRDSGQKTSSPAFGNFGI